MSSSKGGQPSADLAEHAEQIFRAINDMLANGSLERISDRSLQQLLTAGVKLYVARREAGAELSPFLDDAVTATEVSVMAHAMLRAADMQVFELSLWSGFGTG
jgi:hypothetical protein